MLLGHIVIGITAKKFNPKLPLWVQISGAIFLDIIAVFSIIFFRFSSNLVSLSHSLFMSLIWSLLIVFLTLIITRNIRTSLLLGLLVLSHWILDFVTWPMKGTSGLPIFFKGLPEVGLGLYSTTIGSVIGEITGLIVLLVISYYNKIIPFSKKNNKQVLR